MNLNGEWKASELWPKETERTCPSSNLKARNLFDEKQVSELEATMLDLSQKVSPRASACMQLNLNRLSQELNSIIPCHEQVLFKEAGLGYKPEIRSDSQVMIFTYKVDIRCASCGKQLYGSDAFNNSNPYKELIISQTTAGPQ